MTGMAEVSATETVQRGMKSETGNYISGGMLTNALAAVSMLQRS